MYSLNQGLTVFYEVSLSVTFFWNGAFTFCITTNIGSIESPLHTPCTMVTCSQSSSNVFLIMACFRGNPPYHRLKKNIGVDLSEASLTDIQDLGKWSSVTICIEGINDNYTTATLRCLALVGLQQCQLFRLGAIHLLLYHFFFCGPFRKVAHLVYC